MRYLILLFFCYWMIMVALPVHAQWKLIADGEPWSGNLDESIISDSNPEQEVIRLFHQEGYLYASIDSLDSETQTIFVTSGHRAKVGNINLLGMSVTDPSSFPLPLKRGDWITSKSLELTAEAILKYYTVEGYLLAEVAIESIIPHDSVRHDVALRVREKKPARLEQVILHGAKRTESAYVHHISGVTVGQILKNYDSEKLRRKLEATGIFSRVDSPLLYQSSESSVVIHVPVQESPPGAFDLVLGYERGEGGKGALVGNGRLLIRNPFGGARTLEIALNRAPRQLGYVLFHVETPLIFGLPLGLKGSFEGFQQDSTYGKREYGARFGYWIDSSTQIFASIGREVTRPGLAGTEILDGIQRIPISDAFFFGGGIQIRQVDHALNPTRGYLFEMHAETGHKDAERVTIITDSTLQQRRLPLGRLTAEGRLFVPLSQRTLLATGGDFMFVHSRQIDESDLFRIGGTQSLRGYDEHRFRAALAVRGLAEFRYLVDRVTYGFGFLDLGYLYNRQESQFPSGWYPGFGVGFQVSTAAGIINFTLASTAEDISAVRAHIGLSLGL